MLFFKDNSSVVMKRISMDGRRQDQEVLHSDDESVPGSISLHYVTQHKLLLLLDREQNTIRYFSDDKGKLRVSENLLPRNIRN